MKKLILNLYFILMGCLIVALWAFYFPLTAEYPLMSKDAYITLCVLFTGIYVWVVILILVPSFKHQKDG